MQLQHHNALFTTHVLGISCKSNAVFKPCVRQDVNSTLALSFFKAINLIKAIKLNLNSV